MMAMTTSSSISVKARRFPSPDMGSPSVFGSRRSEKMRNEFRLDDEFAMSMNFGSFELEIPGEWTAIGHAVVELPFLRSVRLRSVRRASVRASSDGFFPRTATRSISTRYGPGIGPSCLLNRYFRP